jgi:hypothetical protein
MPKEETDGHGEQKEETVAEVKKFHGLKGAFFG